MNSEWKETELGKLPAHWEVGKIGDYFTILSGYAFKTNDFAEKGIPVIKIKNIVPPNIEIDDAQFVSQQTADLRSRYKLSFNDILISLTGSNVNQIASAVGKVSKVRFKNKTMVMNQRVGKFENKNTNKYIDDLLYYYISTSDMRFQIASMARGSANQANISPSQLLGITIPVPPLPEQKRIAEILSSLDDKIELNNKMNKNLEEMAQAIFKQWFVDFDFPGENGNPYKSSGGKMIQSELGEIPEAWSVKALGEICEIGSGKRPGKKQDLLDSEFTIPLVGATKIMGYTKEILYDEPLLIIGRVGTHGVIQKYNEPIWASDNTLVIKAKYYEFTYHILNSIDYGSLNRGSTQPLITQTDIKNIKIIFSSNNLQMKFENFVKDLNYKIAQNDRENQLLTKTRDTLLPKLMSGEIRV